MTISLSISFGEPPDQLVVISITGLLTSGVSCTGILNKDRIPENSIKIINFRYSDDTFSDLNLNFSLLMFVDKKIFMFNIFLKIKCYKFYYGKAIRG